MPLDRVLHPSDVTQIRHEFASGDYGVMELSRRWEVSHTTIRNLLLGRTYKEVPGPLAFYNSKRKRLDPAPAPASKP